MEEVFKKILWDKCGGLIPAIAQDYETKEVLMLGFMDKEALELSMKTGFAHYYSRSKKRIWKKGEQSGHTQKILSLTLDCDKDSVLMEVQQQGVACHKGVKSCFFQSIDCNNLTIESKIESRMNASTIYGAVDALYHILLERKHADSHTSYTAQLYQKGENTIAKKIVEEAAELGFALKDGQDQEIIYEAADLLYHALVGLAYKDISPDLVRQEIVRRFGLSGIDEKNAR